MVWVRIVTVIGMLLSVVLILFQNQNPSVALVWLGMRSQPQPLGFWIAGAMLMGALFSLVLFALLSMVPRVPRSPRRPKARPADNPQFNRTPGRGTSDWEEPMTTDWYGNSPADPFVEDESDYFADDLEDRPEDEDEFFDDPEYGDPVPPWEKRESSYSYSSRDPKFKRQRSQRESVFDAEYRVINPPPRPETSREDWDEFDDSLE